MRKLLTICAILLSLSASAQWQLTGSKVRYVNGIGIPTKDTAAGVGADSSQILIRPADSSLYVKYKRTWMRVGGGGGSIAGSGTTNYVPKFTSSSAIGNSQIFDNGTAVGIGTTSLSSWRSGARAIQFGANGFGSLWEQASGSVDLSFASYESAANTFAYRTTGDVPTLYQQVTGVHSWSNAPSGTAGNTITWNERMRISASGDVGIGTASPAQKLDVNGFILSSTSLYKNAAGTNVLNVAADDQQYGGSSGDGGIFVYGNNKLHLSTNSSRQLTVNGLGNVGIGYTSPATRLSVNGTTLINTNTDNGVDKLQVSGSATVSTLLGVGISPSQGTLHIRQTSPSITIDDADNAGTASINFRPTQAAYSVRGSINLISKGIPQTTELRIAATDTMTLHTNSVERVRITPTGRILAATTTDNGTDRLQVNGSIQGTGFNQAYTAKTATYTATTSDYFIDCTTGTFTINLFTAVGNTGRILIIKNSGTGTITVDPNGSQTIDGATTQTLSTQWSRVHIISDGANWKIISN